MISGLFPFAHRRSEGKAHQQVFRRGEAADGLPPRFLLVLDEHSISAPFELCRGSIHAFHFKLQPCLRDWDIVRPGIFTETRLRRLRKRPQSKVLCALKNACIKIAAGILFERDAKDIAVEESMEYLIGVGLAVVV